MISRLIIFRMVMFHTNILEEISTHILCSVKFSENRTCYEVMWKNKVQRDRPK